MRARSAPVLSLACSSSAPPVPVHRTVFSSSLKARHPAGEDEPEDAVSDVDEAPKSKKKKKAKKSSRESRSSKRQRPFREASLQNVSNMGPRLEWYIVACIDSLCM